MNWYLKKVAAIALAGVMITCAAGRLVAADWGGEPGESGSVREPRGGHLYVRGDIGIGRNDTGDFSQEDLAGNGGSFISHSIDDTVFIGAGIGIQVNRRLRFDLTGEYRAGTPFEAIDNLAATLAVPAGDLQANTIYEGRIRSYVGLFNAYWDLFSHRGFTPYLGAGLGFAHNTVDDLDTLSVATFTDALGVQTTQVSPGRGGEHSETNLAWALMAGTSYDLAPGAKLDLGYRYLDLGSGLAASSDILECVCGTVGKPLRIDDLESHEFRIGIRWSLGAGPESSLK
jgi:opacity protein-like surface antigen